MASGEDGSALTVSCRCMADIAFSLLDKIMIIPELFPVVLTRTTSEKSSSVVRKVEETRWTRFS
jgi:hypothetical protein